jgi:hypothetical protein
MRPGRAIVFAVAFTLTGCSAFERLSHPPPARPVVAPPTAPPEARAVPPPIPVPPPSERPPQPIDPKKLVGLTQEETKRLFGAPAAVRDEPPAVVWSYGSTGCGLEMFFYLDLTNQTFKALTYDLKAKNPRGLQGSACLASLRTATP